MSVMTKWQIVHQLKIYENQGLCQNIYRHGDHQRIKANINDICSCF